MLNDATCFKDVYIVCGYTDLRKGIDSLAAIVDGLLETTALRQPKLFLFILDLITLLITLLLGT